MLFSFSFSWKTAGILTWDELLISIFICTLMSRTRDEEFASLLGFDVNCIFSEVLERRLFQRIHSCYVFYPGVWFLMFVEKTSFFFFFFSFIDMRIQKVLMFVSVINGISVQLFLETWGKMLWGEALEIPQNDKMTKAKCSARQPLCFLSWDFTAKGKDRSDCS